MITLGITPLPIVEREIVISLKPTASRGRSGRFANLPSPGERLLAALRLMRQLGYEVDLYLRGTWAVGKRPKALDNLKLEGWRLTPTGIVASGDPVCWTPMVARKPAPEIVVRGVR